MTEAMLLNMPAATALHSGTVSVIRTWNARAVARVLRHPACWDTVRDDMTPEDWLPTVNRAIAHLMILQGDYPVGAVMFHPLSSILYQGHVAALPGARGRTVLQGMRLALSWMRDNSSAREVCAMVPTDDAHRPARRICAALGMQRTGILPRSHLSGGKRLDQAIYSINLDG